MATPQLTGDHPLAVKIVTRSKIAWEGRADEVQAPGFSGEFGALPDHALYLTSTGFGIVTVHSGSDAERFVVGPGFADVGPDHVTLLVDLCEPAGEVDKNAAGRALAEAEERVSSSDPDSDERMAADKDVALARAQLEA